MTRQTRPETLASQTDEVEEEDQVYSTPWSYTDSFDIPERLTAGSLQQLGEWLGAVGTIHVEGDFMSATFTIRDASLWDLAVRVTEVSADLYANYSISARVSKDKVNWCHREFMAGQRCSLYEGHDGGHA